MKYEFSADIDKEGNVSPLMIKRCLRCGRKLKTPEAQELGYGKICWEKHQKDTQTLLF